MPSFVVAQIGARMHYAVPRILYEAGLLERLYTDFSGARAARWLSAVPALVQPQALTRFASRTPAGIPAHMVTPLPGFGFRYRWRRSHARSLAEVTAAFTWGGESFCRAVLRGRRGAPAPVYGFHSACMELIESAHAAGLPAVVEQCGVPLPFQRAILRREQGRFPGWLPDNLDGPTEQDFFARERAEWNAADLIVCPSPFVAQAVEASGGPALKCAVVPYGVEPGEAPRERARHGGKLRVLAAGSVSLAKGSHYVLQAARALKKEAEFRLVGEIAVPDPIARLIAGHADLVGPVPRKEMRRHYEWADVLVLPSLFEGSATVTYEALAAGLPVICSANSGSVVRDGLDGFVVPAGGAEEIIARLLQFVRDPEMRLLMARSARTRAAAYDIPSYGRRLCEALARCACA